MRADEGQIETRVRRLDFRSHESGDLVEYGLVFGEAGKKRRMWGRKLSEFPELEHLGLK